MASPTARGLLLVALCLACVASAAGSTTPAPLNVDIDLTFLGISGFTVIRVVKDGVIQADIQAAAALVPIPASLMDATLLWQASNATKYNITLTTNALPSQMRVQVATPSTGIVNSTASEVEVKHTCLVTGTFRVTVDVQLRRASDDTPHTPINIQYVKDCSLSAVSNSVSSLPMCQPNQDLDYARVKYGPIKMATFDVYGFPDSGVNTVQGKADEVVQAIQDGDYDVVALQQVYGLAARTRLKQGLTNAGFPYIVDLMEGAAVNDAGMVFASKLRPRRCSFQEFADSHDVDSLASKGVFGALLDVGAQYSLWVFATHTQSGQSTEAIITRSKQLAQASNFLIETVTAVAVPSNQDGAQFGGANLNRMGIVFMGNFNVEGNTYNTDGSFKAIGSGPYGGMLGALGNPRDLYREANPTAPGYTTMPYHVTCATAVSSTIFSCTVGEVVSSPGQRIDYVLAYSSFPAHLFNDLQLGASSVVKVENPNFKYLSAGNYTFPSLSYHYLVTAEVTHKAQEPNSAASLSLSMLVAALAACLALIVAL